MTQSQAYTSGLSTASRPASHGSSSVCFWLIKNRIGLLDGLFHVRVKLYHHADVDVQLCLSAMLQCAALSPPMLSVVPTSGLNVELCYT